MFFAMEIDHSGNVGIDTTNPAARLDVNGGALVGTSPVGGDMGVGTINIGGNYYINGIPISTFIDAPSDGNLYARRDAGWDSIGAGAGTISDLGFLLSSISVEVTNTGGDNTILPRATIVDAGVMAAADKVTLESALQSANLGSSRSSTAYTVTMDVGSNATLFSASSAEAGVMSAAQVQQLNSLVSDAIRDTDFTANGLMVRTSSGSYASRTLSKGSLGGVTVVNGNGGGDLTVELHYAIGTGPPSGTPVDGQLYFRY